MNSMTGFGRAVGEVLGQRCVCEVRSVNHRFLDLKLRLPPGWQDAPIEQLLAQHLRRTIDRGSVQLLLRFEGISGASVPAIGIDHARGRAYGRALRELAESLGLSPSPQLDAQLLALAAAQPGVLLGGGDVSPDELFLAVAPVLDQALLELRASRAREGAALAAELRGRLTLLREHTEIIAAQAAAQPEVLRRRLEDRVARLLQAAGTALPSLDPQRLAQEVAYLADRGDITEELARLRAHFEEFIRQCEADKAGRRLDFLTQELNREVNTIGSKSQSAEIAARVVAMKAELERLREQIQNVE